MKRRSGRKLEVKRRVSVLVPPILDNWFITCRELAARGRLPNDPGLWLEIAAGMDLYVQANLSTYQRMRSAFGLPHANWSIRFFSKA